MTSTKPYKSAGGTMVYNEELKRDIPEGWEVGTFETSATIIGGITPSKAVQETLKEMSYFILEHPHSNEIIECHINQTTAMQRGAFIIETLQGVLEIESTGSTRDFQRDRSHKTN
jgi:hypothetical protein